MWKINWVCKTCYKFWVFLFYFTYFFSMIFGLFKKFERKNACACSHKRKCQIGKINKRFARFCKVSYKCCGIICRSAHLYMKSNQHFMDIHP